MAGVKKTKMRLLVTGGAGFIGSNFITYWLKRHPKDKIINLDKLTYAGNQANLREVADSPNYKFVKGSICNGKLVDKLVQEVDIIVHFAAESHVDRSILGPQLFLRTNILGTQVLLDACVRYKIKRFHHVSTDEVFGALPRGTKEKFNEQSLFRPNSPYAASKAASDCLVRAYFKTYELPVTTTNTSNNFGPYQFPEKLIPLAITNLMEGGRVPVYGDGLYVRDWLYVEDHCRAIEMVLQSDKVGETYCVGGMTEEIANIQIVQKICQAMGRKFDDSVEFVTDRPGHDRRYSVDWRKIKKELGWKPKYDFDKALVKTVGWYQENINWWKPLKRKQKKYFQKQHDRK